MTSHSDFLRALTDHLDRHGLPIVNIHSEHAGGWTLQLIADGAAHDLVAWASSLGAAGLYVHPILDKPQVSAGFRATIEGWSVGRGGAAWMHYGELMGLTHVRTTISQVDLAYYARPGRLPDDPEAGAAR